MSNNEFPLSELTATMMREVFSSIIDSAVEQTDAYVELATRVGVPLGAYQGKLLGITSAEQLATAQKYIREILFPLLALPPPSTLPDVIAIDDQGRQLLGEHFRAVVAVVSTPAGAAEVTLLDAMSGGSPSWRLSTGLLAEFAIERLKQDSASEYNKLRAIVGAGMQNVVVTGGELTTKVTMQLSTPGETDPAVAAQQQAELARRRVVSAARQQRVMLARKTDTTVRSARNAQSALRTAQSTLAKLAPSALGTTGVRVRLPGEESAAARRSAELFGSVKLEFRTGIFPSLSAPPAALPAEATGPSTPQPFPQWIRVADMATPRYTCAAIRLGNGHALVAGGYNDTGLIGTAEIYDSTARAWLGAGTLLTPRIAPGIALLPSGRALVIGGLGRSGYLATTELYDPATSTWSAGPTMSAGRGFGTTTVLRDGRVLVAGGTNGSSGLATAELYDPTTNIWASAGSMAVARWNHTAVALPSGKVLVTAGSGNGGAVLAAAELYDPVTNTWSPAGALGIPRYSHSTVLLASGKILVTGGLDGSDGDLLAADLYDPTTNSWTSAAPPGVARSLFSLTPLPDGRILAFGGASNRRGATASVEFYDPAANAWTHSTPMLDARCGNATVVLNNGQILVAGGLGIDDQILPSVELCSS